MQPSKHNIILKTRNSGRNYIINLLTGNADQLDPGEAEKIINGDPGIALYAEKGYLADVDEENALFRRKYLDFMDQRERDEIQLFFVPGYNCNFSCSYCYQRGYQNDHENLSREVTDAFFRYVDNNFRNRRFYITLFGGEPLLINKPHVEAIRYFADRCREARIPLAVVTNGYYLEEYLGILELNEIKEIQLTLDGPESVHDSRRMLKSGTPTFNKIVRGIDLALAKGIPINLRVVLDLGNINALPGLARFAIEKGWTGNTGFKTQLGRNYELHYCQDVPEKLLTRLELWKKVFQLIPQYPEILEFHKPAFSVSRFLSENGELPEPLFDSCPGCKTEWAFDYTGHIYACTATVGKTGDSLGTFYPEVSLKSREIAAWQNRDILSIPGCRECNLQLVCGGGCAAVSRNKNGRLDSPDCRPVKELMEMGMELYFTAE